MGAVGEAAPESRVRIRVPDTYKQVSEHVWADLEEYIYQGFLSSASFLFDSTYVFKTLNHHELRHVQYLKPSRVSPAEARDSYRANFIAHSVFMIDGRNMLVDRHRKVVRLSRTVMRMDAGVQAKIMENLAALNSRAARLHPLAEIYVHENRSRFRWLHTLPNPVHDPSNTGVQGTDGLGMNYCQQAWTALNRLLDSKEQMERDWANSKFVGSCFAGKGVRAIDERDKARREREKSDLEDTRMAVLHAYLNRRPGAKGAEPTVMLPDGRKAVVQKKFQAESAEELARQLEASLAGEKDHHDLVVERHVQRLKQATAQVEETKNRLYSLPASSEPGSRVLGGKEEAENLLRSIEAMKEQRRRQLRIEGQQDAQSSDEAGKDGPVGPQG